MYMMKSVSKPNWGKSTQTAGDVWQRDGQGASHVVVLPKVASDAHPQARLRFVSHLKADFWWFFVPAAAIGVAWWFTIGSMIGK